MRNRYDSSFDIRHFSAQNDTDINPSTDVLALKDITLAIGKSPDEQLLLNQISLLVPRGHFAAIIGPSGCGKSTLLKVIAGIKEHTDGSVHWEGRDLSVEGDMDPHEIGYVPQFSIAHELLNVDECIESTLRLRVEGLSGEELDERIEKVLKSVGLNEISDRRVSLLSGGQKRRLAMAMEMASSPHLLLCDEVTSGLDPKSEDEIVMLMNDLSRTDGRIVLSVTHSLQHVALYDSVIVLYQGQLAYHGSPELLVHYFGIKRPEDLYPRLAQRRAKDWHDSWLKYRDAYYEQSKLPDIAAGLAKPEKEKPAEPESEAADAHEVSEEEEVERLRAIVEGRKPKDKKAAGKKKPAEAVLETHPPTPGVFSQFAVLLARRWKLFFRDKGQLILQLALLFGFPCLVVIFALDGLPDVKRLGDSGVGTLFERMKQESEVFKSISKTGGLVSGLIMFQVILLALMGSNNAAREIAGERSLFEKEKFAGLSPLAYVGSKVVFLGALVLAQSIWMTIFVNFVVGFEGSFLMQALSLILVNGAMTAVCLAISSWTKSAEQSSLLSIYLVGFQLPLSGAVLALPKAIALLTQVFIASYWGWSGFIRSMESTRYYDSMTNTGVLPTDPAGGLLCVWVLLAHIILGLFLAYTGSKNSRWE
jgi:ABC-type multidrug transport system ATPase subunit